jgi:hypothetical protein
VSKTLSTPAPGEKYCVCEIDFVDVDYEKPCPRCRQPCQRTTHIRILPRGQIRRSTIHAPICSCPDEHIRQAIVKLMADILVKDYLEATQQR